MIRAIGAVAVLLLSSVIAIGQPAFRTLRFLPDGHMQFGAGPELDLAQLKNEIKRMARSHDCRDVHLKPERDTSYSQVEAALKLFQQFGCNDLGFRGIEGSN